MLRPDTPEYKELQGLIVAAVEAGVTQAKNDIRNTAELTKYDDMDAAIRNFIDNARVDTGNPLHQVINDPSGNHGTTTTGQLYDIYVVQYGNESFLGSGDLNNAITHSQSYSTGVIVIRTPGSPPGSYNPPAGTIYNGRVFSPAVV